MIGRFTSPDTIVPNPAYPQSLNRYSYCLNNPLKWIDPSGHQYEHITTASIMSYAQQNWNNPNAPLTQYVRSVGLGLAMISAVSSPVGAAKLAVQVASLSSAGATAAGAGPMTIGISPVSSGAPSASIPSDSRSGLGTRGSDARQEETLVTEGGIRWYGIHGEISGIVKRNPRNGVEAEAFQAKGRASIFGLYGEVQMIDLDVPVVRDLIGNNGLTLDLTGPGAAVSYSTLTGLPSYGGHLAGGGLDLGESVGGRVYIGLYTPYAGYDSASKQVTLRIGPFEGHFRWPF